MGEIRRKLEKEKDRERDSKDDLKKRRTGKRKGKRSKCKEESGSPHLAPCTLLFFHPLIVQS